MDAGIVWVTPLLILPGICLLIVSTSSRYSALHDEIHRWLDDDPARVVHTRVVIAKTHLAARAVYFRNALVALYTAVFVFVCASALGAVLDFLDVAADVAVFAVALVGILAVGYASAQLIRESLLSLQVIKFHIDQAMEAKGNDTTANSTGR